MPKSKSKSVFQKASLVSAFVSFVLSLVSGVMLYLQIEKTNSDDPISAAFMAAVFFFICVGVVLFVIGTANIPSFKLDNSDEK